MMESFPLIQAAILVPMLAGALILKLDRYPNARETVSLVAGIITAAISVTLYVDLESWLGVKILVLAPLPGLELAFRLDELGTLFALVASMLWPVTTLYALGYMRAHKEPRQTQFYAWFAIAIGSTMAIALSANLFTLFVFYELLTLTTYPLVTHSGTDAARASGRLYLGMLLGTSIAFFLLALIATWLLAGTLTFTPGGVFPHGTSTLALGALLVLFVFGIGKAAIMPFHRWLPAAMVAPTPVSALLHAVAVVKAGVFTLLKVCVFIFGIDLVPTLPTTSVLMYLAAASILLASIVAMRQDNLKKRLAYSTISQLNYIVMGALISSGAAIVGSAMHIAMHAVAKITLFFCAGAILVTSHKTEISDMRGLGKRMPLTMAAFFIGSLGIVGVPPTGGTWSKWYLLLGTLESHEWALMVILMLSSLLTIVYLLAIPIRAFFPGDNSNIDTATNISLSREAPLPMMLAIVITTLATLGLFFFPQPIHELAQALVEPGDGP